MPGHGAAIEQHENPRSTGIVLRYGMFRFLDLGDLSGSLFDLVCPRDAIGRWTRTSFTSRRCRPGSLLRQPRVAIMNNGLKKGGARTTYEALHRVPHLEDVWQLHASADAGDSNFPAGYRQRGREHRALDQARRERGRLIPCVQSADEDMEGLPARHGRRTTSNHDLPFVLLDGEPVLYQKQQRQ